MRYHPKDTLIGEWRHVGVLWWALGKARRSHDRVWDARLRIDTRSLPEHHYRPLAADVYAPSSTPYSVLNRILASLVLTPNDALVDVGCGAGRVVCVAARYPIRSAVGVELDPGQVKRASINLEMTRGKRAMHSAIVQQNALDFDYGSATLVFLFNPFGEDTMASFARRLDDTMQDRLCRGDSSPMTVVYYNPTAVGELTRRSTWVRTVQKRQILRHPVIFLSSGDRPRADSLRKDGS